MDFNLSEFTRRLIADGKLTTGKATETSLRPRIAKWYVDRRINNQLSTAFYKGYHPVYYYRLLREYGIGSARELLGPEFVEFRDKLDLDEEMAAILYISRREMMEKKGVDVFAPIVEVEDQDYKKGVLKDDE